MELRACSDAQIAETLAIAYELPFIRLTPRVPDPRVAALLPVDFLTAHRVLPLFVVDDTLTLAVAEPADVFAVDAVASMTGHEVQTVVTTAADMDATLHAWCVDRSSFACEGWVDEPEPGAFALDTHARSGTNGAGDPGARLAESWLYRAIRDGATAIHFEPGKDQLRIRLRVDGALHEAARHPMPLFAGIERHIRAAAGLRDDTNRGQDGTARATVDGRDVRMSVSIAPCSKGGGRDCGAGVPPESAAPPGQPGPDLAKLNHHRTQTDERTASRIVVRVLDSDRSRLRLDQLGFGYDMLKQWRRALASRRGLLLVCGPADSGRMTTLHASLAELDPAAAHLCTIEDPIRYPIADVTQFQVPDADDHGHAAVLEMALRQDPDAILACDLPDARAARLAVRAANRRQLVLAGSDAPDAPAAVAALLRLGVEPYLLATSLVAVLSQRMVRRLCPHCRTPRDLSPAESRQVDALASGKGARAHPHSAASITGYEPAGCPRCRNTGFIGRVGVFQLLVPDDAFREHLADRPTLAALRAAAAQSGLRPIAADVIDKLAAGITTLEEFRAIE